MHTRRLLHANAEYRCDICGTTEDQPRETRPQGISSGGVFRTPAAIVPGEGSH